ncbi:hypothetical protein B9Z55_002190 [Caenorhabditis nigoni]|uniref:C2H2-type domain-containing protein n=2 Tax=Caenorhabditis nigoni TaxID=1611254 RepID=A0A2G5VJK3_9PELO|nr:hypothetical protein B9Z55_002190 [Caenorhabditis nigoni]
MSHINLYSLPTDQKNMIRCRFCVKVYKIDNGSSGFIRHLRCKHPDSLLQMGGSPTDSGKEQKLIHNDSFVTEAPPTENNNDIDMELEGNNDVLSIMMQDMTTSQFIANFMNQVDGDEEINRVVDKRPRISQAPVSSSTSNLLETNEEQELKLFDNPLHIFLSDINKLAEQNGEFSEANEESSSSASAVDVSTSTKGSREPTPNCSLLYKSDNMESPQIFNPLTPFGCVFCQASYHRIKDLTIHLTRVHSTRYRCNCCLAQFVQPQHLEHHYSTCHVIETQGKEEVMNNQ